MGIQHRASQLLKIDWIGDEKARSREFTVSEERRGFPPYGVDFTPPDFAAIALAFGIAGRRVSSIAEAKSCAEQAFTERAPFVLDVPIDYREYYDLV